MSIPFDTNALTDATKNGLSKQWVGVFNDSTSFHEHEWTKHGTCYENDQLHPSQNLLRNIQSDPYQDAYFKQTMSLNSQNNVIQRLAAKGINPNLTTGYAVEVLYDAIGVSKSNSLLSCKVSIL
jgi:ribonuclease T2